MLGLVHEPEEESCPNFCWTAPAAVAHRRRARDSLPADPRVTRACATPADPPKVEEIIAVMRAAGAGAHGRRLRGLVAILWRAGLRIQEALALAEADLDYRRGSLLVRRGKGGRRREVGTDAWGWRRRRCRFRLGPWCARCTCTTTSCGGRAACGALARSALTAGSDRMGSARASLRGDGERGRERVLDLPDREGQPGGAQVRRRLAHSCLG